MEHHLKRGQVYAPCGQPKETARYVRIVRPGGKRVLIADAATGRREREVDANRLHEYPTRNGLPQRTGYALADTHEWLTLLTDLALRKYPYTISASAIDQDVRRGGYVRLEPNVALEATLETADWTVEPTTTAVDELRVRYRGKDRCPSMLIVPTEGRQYCTRWRDDHDEHQDDQTLHQWKDATPQPPAWWLTDQPQTKGYDNKR
ncbi:hypothetical protein ABIE67_009635 [Streptomyces sp. V4I8]|uniref:hypothetical protein n=1 Tax=Streptomyces sp. V4I8 TaxID=3156469 RepID=UPI003515E711